MNKDLTQILAALRKGGNVESGINFDISEEGALRLRGSDGYTPQKGIDYWTPEEVNAMVKTIFDAAKPKRGVDYYTDSEKRAFIAEVLNLATPIKGIHYCDGVNGKDGCDGKDAEQIDARQVAIDAINFLESFKGDARLSAKALKDLDVAVTEILKNGANFTFSEGQIKTIKDLLPQYPPINAGGSGATFLKSLRDVDLSSLTKNADGKYVLGGSGSSTFLALTDTPATYASQAGKLLAVKTGEDGVEFIAPPSGTGDVVGPVSATADGIAVYNGITGKVIKDGGATVAQVRDRSTHTGTQSADTIVDGITNHVFTALDDTKLAGIATGAQVNNISDVNATDLTDGGDTALHTHSAYALTSHNHTGVYAPVLGADDNYVTDAEKAALHSAVTVTDGTTINFTLTGQDITAEVIDGTITLAKQANMATGSLVYRKTAGAGVPEVQTLATLKIDLGLTGTNSGDQTSIAGITGTKAQFDTAVTDGDIMYIGDAPTTHTHALSEVVGSTTEAFGVGTLELGHATDTTLSRVSAGVIAVEGVTVPTISSTSTFTNKRLTKRIGTTTSSATPTINTDNYDVYRLTAQTVDITSFTTNLTGTPSHDDNLIIEITGTAARAITWGASFEASTVALPTTTVTTAMLKVGFQYNDATSKWRCIASA